MSKKKKVCVWASIVFIYWFHCRCLCIWASVVFFYWFHSKCLHIWGSIAFTDSIVSDCVCELPLYLSIDFCQEEGVGWGWVPQCLCGGQRASCRSQFSPFPMWDLGKELRPSNFLARPFPTEPSHCPSTVFSAWLTCKYGGYWFLWVEFIPLDLNVLYYIYILYYIDK